MADSIDVTIQTAPITVTVDDGTTVMVGAGTVGPAGPKGDAGTNGTNGQGVPTGGSTGQVLAKKSGTNYDTEWVDQSGGGGGGSGTVTSVTGTAPISVATGTTTPVVSVAVGTTANTVAAGDDSRIAGAVQKASNLSDLASASTARTNLGLGDSATKNVGTSSGTVAAGDDSRLSDTRTPTDGSVTTAKIVDGAVTSGKIADGTIVDADVSATAAISTSKISGLGDSATKNVGTTAGTVAAGDDSRLSNARTPTAHKASHATGGTDALAPSDIGAVPTTRTVNGSALSSDITISAAPSGSAGGDLTGTYPNPTIGAGKVTVAKLSATGTASSSTFLRGDGSWATATDSGALQKTSNLSDLGTLSTARSNLGVAPVGSGYVSSVNVSGLIAETLNPSMFAVSNQSILSSGRLQMVGIYIPAGTTVTSISFCSGTTALATGTNQWFVLTDSGRSALRYTVDDTSTAWAANTVKTLALTSTYTVSTSGLYYLGIMVAATTVPSLRAISMSNVALSGESFQSSTGQTTPPATGTTFTLGTRQGTLPWAAIS